LGGGVVPDVVGEKKRGKSEPDCQVGRREVNSEGEAIALCGKMVRGKKPEFSGL